jgi:deoxyribodipyrimidine photo-lyase
MTSAILWFRRDLRLHDHPALHDALASYDTVVPVFCLDDRLLHGRFASGPRTAFMLGCLEALDAELRRRASRLVMRHGRPEEELPRLAREAGAAAVYWTSDVSPFARARDRRVSEALGTVAAEPRGGNYVADVRMHRPYVVFTPFHRAWLELERRPVHPAPGALGDHRVDPGRLPSLGELGLDAGGVDPIVEPGEAAARRALERFLDGPVGDYGARRDTPAGGSSVLSPHLRWGCVSAREVEQRAAGRDEGAPFVRQLAWRDFHAHVLLHHPGNLRTEHQERYRGTLEWDDDAAALRAWQEGRTGYPVVDAGMRQLAATGWMHNRARMVAGSFLTRDLHLDWRTGEAWFERMLLDGEPAQNNGNWQWIASVGVDPAPHFRRLFNPILQARRFDPDGTYVRRWVPELRGVATEDIFEPWDAAPDYARPIVDHARERRVAIERYRAAAGR